MMMACGIQNRKSSSILHGDLEMKNSNQSAVPLLFHVNMCAFV